MTGVAADGRMPGMDDRLYFAYGSNMNPARMAALGVSWQRREAAILPGWRLSFSKRASDAPPALPAAYATVVADAGAWTEGVLYTLAADADRLLLDAFENLYERRRVRVVTGGTAGAANARTCEADVYVALPSVCADGLLPECWYVGHLLQACDLLSPAWCRNLRALSMLQSVPRW